MLCETPSLSRRRLLGSAGALFAWAHMPRLASAAGTSDRRFVTIILRGGLDGLSAVPPIGEPGYAGLRGAIALERAGEHPVLPLLRSQDDRRALQRFQDDRRRGTARRSERSLLGQVSTERPQSDEVSGHPRSDADPFFALHPSLPNLARLYRAGDAAILHAVSSPYRNRSHFAGQDVLESGYPAPGTVHSGWLNRLVAELPPGEPISDRGTLGVGPVTPLIARGPAPVLGWNPVRMPEADDDTAARLLRLYDRQDQRLHAALAAGLETHRIAGSAGDGLNAGGGPGTPQGMVAAATGAARLLAKDDGPRVAALGFNGWDTHANEGGADGRLARILTGFDDALAAFEAELGPVWQDTVILVITEFGRTVEINGSLGTDHGIATTAFLTGGAVNGGRLITDWPGLRPADLYEGRDLTPTTDLRSVIKGLALELFDASPTALAESVFPQSAEAAPLLGLVS